MNVKVLTLSVALFFFWCLLSSCLHSGKDETGQVDVLNSRSYDCHYRNLDSTMYYAERALSLSDKDSYKAGKAEALNNMAFVYIAKMKYDKAHELLKNIQGITDNQIELLVADVQLMRLCQRQSDNKYFYIYRQRAITRLNRIIEEKPTLDERQRKRLVYAESEFSIVASTYFYYVGLSELSVKAISGISPEGDIVKDMPQLLDYYYNVGSGGVIAKGSKEGIAITEFECLIRCYLMSRQNGYLYWEANSLQAMSEHLQDSAEASVIYRALPQEVDFVNSDKMPLRLLAGNLAQRSLNLFKNYGDVYQIAGAYRTLAECYWNVKDYNSAIICLNEALTSNKAINNAPDLVASIREQLSLAYSAINDKPKSDYNRNIYLDMQEKTRQDRQLEARAEQLSTSSMQLNLMIVAVVVMIVVVVFLLFAFDYTRRRRNIVSVNKILQPLTEWEKANNADMEKRSEEYDEIIEQTEISKRKLYANKVRNIELKSKVALANDVIPLINRISNEVARIKKGNEDEKTQRERYEYVAELTDKINEYNDVLTRWIQMRQGQLSLHIESFKLQELFDIIESGRLEFGTKGVTLVVKPTSEVVKADRTLTLFMINTIVDNARKYTDTGGCVTVESKHEDGYVEISVSDTGVGITEHSLKGIFNHKVQPIVDEQSGRQNGISKSHGFGLLNCTGIIEKYRKVSSLFSVCRIGVNSEMGKGSRFYFRLPVGLVRLLTTFLVFVPSLCLGRTQKSSLLTKAGSYADSAYFSNINGTYAKTLVYADSCFSYLNRHYSILRPGGKDFLKLYSNDGRQPAEISWFVKKVKTDYSVILDVRNETAIAALSLHDWKLYNYNNNIYTKLFRECSADNTLPEYVRVMEKSESDKNIAVIMLICLLVSIFPAYYFLYYRYRIYYNFCIDKIGQINGVLLNTGTISYKLDKVSKIWNETDKKRLESSKLRSLDEVVCQIKDTLSKCLNIEKARSVSTEQAKENLKRIEMENDKVYVRNNILDNCLSALKHETMYYPSRIKQLVDSPERNVGQINELVDYYKNLYTILSAQSMRQIDNNNFVDLDIIKYLWEVLRQINGGNIDMVNTNEEDGRYTEIKVRMNALQLSEPKCAMLFTPLTSDVRFLLCKQILRDIAEITNARRCGIRAYYDKYNNNVIIKIILIKQIWKNLKSSL